MKLFFTISILLILFCSAGCVTYTKSLSESDRVNSEEVYLYGRFNLGKSGNFLKMGLIVKNITKDKEYIIRFKKKEDVYAIRVEPGEFIIVGLSFATGEGIPSGNELFKADYVIPSFHVATGNAYYIGDYFGTASTSVSAMGPIIIGNYGWNLKDVKENFKQTTETLLIKNSAFSSINATSAFDEGILENIFNASQTPDSN